MPSCEHRPFAPTIVTPGSDAKSTRARRHRDRKQARQSHVSPQPGTTVRRNDRKLRRSDALCFVVTVVVSLYRPKAAFTVLLYFLEGRAARILCTDLLYYCTSPQQILQAPAREGACQCQCIGRSKHNIGVDLAQDIVTATLRRRAL